MNDAFIDVKCLLLLSYSLSDSVSQRAADMRISQNDSDSLKIN